MSFDYVAAHKQYAAPAFAALLEVSKSVLASVLPLLADLKQGHNLQIPMNDELKSKFILTADELAELAVACYFYGHWHPFSVHELSGGLYWKVSNCCDQLLSKHYHLPTTCVYNGLGYSLWLNEGMLMRHFNSVDESSNLTIGLATEVNVQRAQSGRLAELQVAEYKGSNELANFLAKV